MAGWCNVTASVLCLLCSLASRKGSDFVNREQQVPQEGSDFADRRRTD